MNFRLSPYPVDHKGEYFEDLKFIKKGIDISRKLIFS